MTKFNTRFRVTFVALALVIAGVCAFLFYGFYREARNITITKLNEEQAIHAKEAARGIEDFFSTWTQTLNSLSQIDAFTNGNEDGKTDLRIFYKEHREQIAAITRLDEKGVIRDNLPDSGTVGTDLSGQKHVEELLREHKPVVSDVFRAVEGFSAVALHVPVFRGSEFKGSIGILINFDLLSKRYLDPIKIGETGYAWVISRDGTILYTPIPGFTGKRVFEVMKDSPSLEFMVKDMLQGRAGVAQYAYDRIGDRAVNSTRKYAVYMPAHLGNTFWSICVASSEKDVFFSLTSLRNKLILVIGTLCASGMMFSAVGARAWLIGREEEKREQAETESKRLRHEIAHVDRVAMMGQLTSTLAHELNQPLGAILRNAEAAELFLRMEKPDIDEVLAILADIRKDEQRAGQVIDRMRTLLKRRDLELAPVGVAGLIGEVVTFVHSEAVARHVVIETELPDGMLQVRGDRVQLQQVLLNLILNAMDAVHAQPEGERRVTVRASRNSADAVEIAVSDTGHGLPEQHESKLFNPFFTTKQQGLGIGLAISRTIVETHGGVITAGNNVDRGATFRIMLPVEEVISNQ